MREETKGNQQKTTAVIQSQDNKKRKKDSQNLETGSNVENEENHNRKENVSDEKRVAILPTKPELDKEIEEIARKIKDANDKKMVQIKKHPTFHPAQSPKTNPNEEISEDWTSVQGQFGWTELAKTMIPYLTRCGKKYVSVRMVDNKIFLKYRQLFTDEVWNCFQLDKLKVTKAEAALLNEINMRHCDNFFGKVHFNINDTIATIDDVRELHEFLDFCFEKIVDKNTSQHKKCGFIRIAGQNCVPYVWYNSKQYVPLFYFEGECKYLEDRAVEVGGWELAYIKISCKIQGIRKALFDSDSMRMVEMDLVKRFFPPDTVFRYMWLMGCGTDSLFRKHRFKIVPPDAPNQEKAPGGRFSIEKQQRVPEIAPYPISCTTNATRSSPSNPTMSTCLNQYVPTPTISYPSGTAARQCTNVVYVNKPTYSTASLPSTVMPYKQTPVLRAVSTPDDSRSRILQIADVLCNTPNSFPYFLVKSHIEEKILNCINMEPFSTASLLITLEDVSAIFFRLRLDLVVRAVNVMRLDIFLPNKLQIRFLERCNKYPTVGLLKYKEFIDKVPQIRYILSAMT